MLFRSQGRRRLQAVRLHDGRNLHLVSVADSEERLPSPNGVRDSFRLSGRLGPFLGRGGVGGDEKAHKDQEGKDDPNPSKGG